MNLLERVAYFQRVWKTTLPHLRTPSTEDAARWCVYPTDAVENALLRTAKRFSPARIAESFDVRQAYRYATATARSIAQSTPGETMNNETQIDHHPNAR